MLEVSKIRTEQKSIIAKLKKRGIDAINNINLILELDQKRIANQQKLDVILAESNQIAKQIGSKSQK